ncbi:WhiB family transcriptional regulator [Streptomyces sp. LHD-70]|uniref:WhiB family transcriptional regulator n=1 Tax=Streptomyces sp. LHD-70 TaxID=3072140 RepID=UPI00280D8C16|nr:WhiB family transcriptional regulator [Streptomyces sp. LHD-70]MDQ8706216.1 WhiB family transcriptional regulator [Streptomyces sp. LHD-70]
MNSFDAAECRNDDVDAEWFFDGTYEPEAKEVCDRCCVRSACLVEALTLGRHAQGVWAGLNDRERAGLGSVRQGSRR